MIPQIIKQKNRLQSSNILSFGILFFSLVISYFLWSYAQYTVDQKAKQKFQNEVKETTLIINQRLDLYINLLYGVQGLFAASDNVKNYEWKTYIEKLDIPNKYPGIVAIRYVQRVRDKEVREFVSHVRRDEVFPVLGYPLMEVHPDTGESDRFIAKYIDPIQGNETMFGWDVAAHPEMRRALDRARDTGRVVATRRLDLLDTLHFPRGIVVFVVPVYKNGASLIDPDRKTQAIAGYVDIVLDVHSMLQHFAQERQALQSIDFEVFDSEDFKFEKILYDDNQTIEAKEADHQPRFWRTTFIETGGQKWALYFGTRSGFGLDSVQERFPLVVLIGSLMISLLLFGVFYSLTLSRIHAIRLAERMTLDLKKLMLFHQAIVESASHCIISTDAAGIITSFNRAAEVLLGYSAQDLIGKESVLLLHDPNEIGKVADELSLAQGRFVTNGFEIFSIKAKERPVFEREWIYVRKDGVRLPVRLSVTALRDTEGMITGFVGIAYDVTQIKKAEEEVKDAVNIKSEFTSMVSHELRTPLAAIKESVSMVEEEATGPINEEQKDLLVTAKRNVERLARLIDAVLDYQKLDSSRSFFNMVPSDINQFVRDTVKSFYAVSVRRGIDFEMELDALLPPVLFDHDRIAQVLINLIDNAFKFTDHGKIVVKTEKLSERVVKISVRDNGVGIHPSDQSKLFQNFTQIHRKGARTVGGTGLGLAISKKIIEAHQGEMGVESSLGEGSIFYFTLPAESRYVTA